MEEPVSYRVVMVFMVHLTRLRVNSDGLTEQGRSRGRRCHGLKVECLGSRGGMMCARIFVVAIATRDHCCE